MANLVEINLHGHLGEVIGETWNLAVNSVGEAIHAINTLKKQKLYQFLSRDDQQDQEYQVLINGESFISESNKITKENFQDIENSNLIAKYNNDTLKSIDIIPVIEGADDALTIVGIVAGVALLATGVLAAAGVGIFGALGGISGGLIAAGAGLLAAGITNLLSQPPSFDDPRFDGGGGPRSFLFSGPVNVTGEGNPVFIQYGRLIVGSQVIGASKKTNDIDANRVNPNTTDIQEI